MGKVTSGVIIREDRADHSPAYLHPEEEPLGPCLKLEHVDPPTGTLRHLLELNVIRKEIKSSSTVPEVLSSQQK